MPQINVKDFTTIFQQLDIIVTIDSLMKSYTSHF